MPAGPTAADDVSNPPHPFDAAACRSRLVRLAVKLVWNRDDAEDIVQDAFRLSLQRGIDARSVPLDAWLWRTVCNLALNHRRKRRAEPLADWVDVSAGETPGDTTERGERLERLQRAIASLPDQQRIAVVLRTMEGLDYPRVAEIMDVSESAARAHVHLGRRALAARIGGAHE